MDPADSTKDPVPANVDVPPQQIADSWIAEIFDRSFLGIVQTDLLGNVLYVNPKANEICGYKDLRTKRLRDLVPDGPSYEVLQKQLADRRRGLSDEYEIEITRGFDRQQVPVLVSSMAVISKSDEPIGAVSIIRSLELDKARISFGADIANSESGADLLKRIAHQTEKAIRFDLLRVSFFTRDAGHARVVFEYPITLAKSARWIAIADSVRDLTLDRRPARYELQKFLGTGQGGVQPLIQAGMLWSMRHPVYRQNRLVGAVSLYTKSVAGFSDRDFEIFSKLPLDTALAGVVFFDALEQLQFTFSLAKHISECETEAEIFERLTRELSSQYGWTHVAIFTFDEIEEILVLQSQFSQDEGTRLPSTYTQPLTKGVLGYVIKTGRDVLISDVNADLRFKDVVYHPASFSGNSSELCMQLSADGRLFALLNIEDVRTNAFTQEEHDTLRRLLDDLGVLIENRRKAQVAAEAVKSTPTALFMVDSKGIIRDSNPAAQALLEYSKDELIGTSIARYAIDPEVGRAVASASNPTGEIELISKTNRRIPGAIVGLPLPGTVNRRMITFRDTRVQRLARELDSLVDIYSEISREIKPSLSIVGACLRDLKQLGAKAPLKRLIHSLNRSAETTSPFSETVDLITDQLRRVELTLDKFMLLERGHSALAVRPMTIYASQFVRDLLSHLPTAEMDAIELQEDTHSYVLADPAQLDLVLRTILSYLLRFREPAKTVTVVVADRADTVLFHFTGPVPSGEENARYRGPDDLIIAETLMDISLGEAHLRQIIETHRGSFSAPVTRDGTLTISFNLPAIGEHDS